MLLTLMLVMTISLVNVEAKADDDEEVGRIPPENYKFIHWMKDVWSLMRLNKRKNTYKRAVSDKLKRMVLFEDSPDFSYELLESLKSKRSIKLRDYLRPSTKIVTETSLLRKVKSISQNLYEIIFNHNGCNPEEVSSINRLTGTFGYESRLGTIIQILKTNTSEYCSRNYQKLMHSTTRLLSRESYNAVVRLTQSIRIQPLNEWNIYDPDSGIIESVSHEMALYLLKSENPLLEDVDQMDTSELKSLIEQIYEDEIQAPNSSFCILINPIAEHISHINMKYINHFTYFQKLVDFSCNIASLATFDEYFKSMKKQLLSMLGRVSISQNDVKVKDNNNSREQYTYDHWRRDFYELFGKSLKIVPGIPEVLAELKRIGEYEKTAEFHLLLNDKETINRSPLINRYFGTSTVLIPVKTTLLRKKENVTQNLISLISGHNGCSSDEIEKIDSVAEIFRYPTKINNILHYLRDTTKSFCLVNYSSLLVETKNLIGKENFIAIAILSEFIKMAHYKLYSTNLTTPSIDSISSGVALYLIGLNHPIVSDIDSMDSLNIEPLVGEVYETEVQYPCHLFCTLLDPIKQNLSHTISNFERNKIATYERLIDLSCKLASLPIDSLRSPILQHLSNFGLDDI